MTLLLRHTRVALPAGVCYGHSDVPLADTWPADFAATLAALRATCAAQSVLPARLRLVTSPLTRCRRLAEHLADQLRCRRPASDPRLMELDFGAFELRPWGALYESGEAKAWFDDPIQTRCPKGESYLDLQRRVNEALSAWRDRIATSPDDTLCLVSHAGPLRVLLGERAGLPPLERLALPLNHGAVRWLACR